MFYTSVNFCLLTVYLLLQMIENTCENMVYEDSVCFKNFNCSYEKRLNCTNKNISKVHMNCKNPDRLTLLYMNDNKINGIENNTFEGLINLRQLYLNDNILNKIENHSFKPLKKLEYLYLRNNHIKYIENNSFESLTNLIVIDLEENQLEKINSGIFTNSSKLWQVYFSANNIVEIKENSFKENSSIEHFYCSHNRISNIVFLKNLPKVVYLNLSYNQIQNISASSLLHLKYLKTLDLSHNNLEVLQSGTLNGLAKLKTLNLSSNKLKQLGEGPFDNLHKLDFLDIRNNFLNSFSWRYKFEEQKVILNIKIDNNTWTCRCIHQMQGLLRVKLIYDQTNSTISNIDGIPCLDEIKNTDKSPSITLRTTTRTPTTKSLNFQISASENVGTTEASTTKIFKKFTSVFTTVTTPYISHIVNSKEKSSVKNREKAVSPEIKINRQLLIIAIFGVTILIIVIITLSVGLAKNCCGNSNIDKTDVTKNARKKRNNFYTTQGADNEDDPDHIYEEIDETFL